MKVLVACEESQTVCKAFREKGHEAYSCDIQEPSGGHPEWHILGDAIPVLQGGTVTTMGADPQDPLQGAKGDREKDTIRSIGRQKMKNNNSTETIGFFGLLALLFIGLKLAGVISWSWWIVLSPIWGCFLLTIFLIIVAIALEIMKEK